MPYSDARTRPWVLEQLQGLMDLGQVRHVVDVGAGAGGWLDFLKPHTGDARWTAVEIWGPYVSQFGLAGRYDTVVTCDARWVRWPFSDLVIFGDVLEHMTAGEAVACWEAAGFATRWAVASLPVYQRYEQGEVGGNPHEEHLHHWDHGTFSAAFPGIVASSPPVDGSCAGAFIARGLLR